MCCCFKMSEDFLAIVLVQKARDFDDTTSSILLTRYIWKMVPCEMTDRNVGLVVVLGCNDDEKGEDEEIIKLS